MLGISWICVWVERAGLRQGFGWRCPAIRRQFPVVGCQLSVVGCRQLCLWSCSFLVFEDLDEAFSCFGDVWVVVCAGWAGAGSDCGGFALARDGRDRDQDVAGWFGADDRSSQSVGL